MNEDMNMDPERERDIDLWLEAALNQDGKSEPRAGLDSRVLASLRAERKRVESRRRWWWIGGAAVAFAAIAAVVWLGQDDRARTPAGLDTVAIRDDDGAGDRPTAPPAPQPLAQQAAKKALRRPTTQRPPHAPELADAARLEQFPAPTPLSEQEKLLARYVEEFPHRAALIARAQTELRKRYEFEMAAPWPQNTEGNGSERTE